MESSEINTYYSIIFFVLVVKRSINDKIIDNNVFFNSQKFLFLFTRSGEQGKLLEGNFVLYSTNSKSFSMCI